MATKTEVPKAPRFKHYTVDANNPIPEDPAPAESMDEEDADRLAALSDNAVAAEKERTKQAKADAEKAAKSDAPAPKPSELVDEPRG
jgi:hypothetical protein